ncbi:flagellar filament capping protein FliD [Heyndrickxia coagulans]|uniref:flagellar filament capping protein FliD n=1 Tax=Heyndrickxia coagulans TaxID=1398 RepID=UPI002EBABD23|nr:flagellar filament capping protein FliD [Heyndrickxia coagulans]
MSSIQRITGLASGMDIDSIVEKMMTAAKQPLVKLQQQKQILEWQEEDYRTLNQKYFDFRSTLSNMKLTTKYRVRTTTSSNENNVTATAANNAALGSATIQSVTQLATAAAKISGTGSETATTISKSGAKIKADASLYSQTGNFLNGITWNNGVVVSQSFSGDGDATAAVKLSNPPVSTTTDGITYYAMNVKVNGKTYQVVNDKSNIPDNEKGNYAVYNAESGVLTFDSAVSAGSGINVEYVADAVTETKTLSKGAATMQLGHGLIATDATGNQAFSLKINNTNYVLGNDNGTYKLYAESDTGKSSPVGTLDASTGLITFTDSSVLSGDNNTVSATYSSKYATMSLGSYNEDGSMNKAAFYIDGTDSLNDVMADVNNHSTLGVSMYYDENADRVSLTRKMTGDLNKNKENNKDDEIIIGGSENDFLNQTLQFNGSDESGGKNAKFTMNGLETERTSNTFTISGVTYTLKSTFDTPVAVTVSNDTDTIFKNIKDFVDQYNSLIDAVQSKLNEDRYSDYAPLTDEQRKEMTDTQQDQWDKKARSGLLRNDMTLKSSLSNMRSLIYSKVNNANISSEYSQLSSIGITTTSDWLEGGKLEIDEDKLKAAIQNDPDSVELLFRASGSTTSEKGIIQRLYDSVNQTYNTIVDKAGKSTYVNTQFTIGKNINDLTDKIRDMNDKLGKLEDRYYAQFTAMEQAIQKYNSQYTYLSSFFSNS